MFRVENKNHRRVDWSKGGLWESLCFYYYFLFFSFLFFFFFFFWWIINNDNHRSHIFPSLNGRRKEGFLSKKGQNIQNWKIRFGFVLPCCFVVLLFCFRFVVLLVCFVFVSFVLLFIFFVGGSFFKMADWNITKMPKFVQRKKEKKTKRTTNEQQDSQSFP